VSKITEMSQNFIDTCNDSQAHNTPIDVSPAFLMGIAFEFAQGVLGQDKEIERLTALKDRLGEHLEDMGKLVDQNIARLEERDNPLIAEIERLRSALSQARQTLNRFWSDKPEFADTVMGQTFKLIDEVLGKAPDGEG
jgi:hypothetical protein